MEATNQVWPGHTSAAPLSEEAANYLTHGAGLVMSLFGLQALFAATHGRGTVGQVASIALFIGSMVVLYLASTLYHAVQTEGLKKRLRTCDHAAIYLLIAGTYTPLLLALSNSWSTWGLAAIWILAAAGVCFKVFVGFGYERLSVTLYLAIGWMGILTIQPLIERISLQGVAWLLAGGLAYSCGAFFYVRSEVKYSHAVWHVFVILGSALHYGAIVLYVVPRTFA
ncbi:MAG: hemolysin III family protein [Pirellulales bacterium]